MSVLAEKTGLVALKPRVLCVDDEPHVLEGLRDLLCRRFDVRIAPGGVEGLELLHAEPESFALVISDMRMPGMAGAEFLRAAREVAPYATRMLLTGHADLEAAIRAVNGARLFRFLTKPTDARELMDACDAALAQHRLQTAERDLLEQTVRGSVDALAEVLALANPAAFGRAGRVKALAGKLARAAELANWWEVEVAAMLADIGAVTLPQATAERLYAGARLTAEETGMVRRVPMVTRHLLAKIPRLEGVIEILAKHEKPCSGEDPRSEDWVPLGARVLRIAYDFAVLESGGSDPRIALGAMRARRVYDEELMSTFAGLVGATVAQVRELSVAELRDGMTLAEDVRSTGGVLLVARGQRVSDQLVERLANLAPGFVHEPLRTYDAERGD
jgi:response regulator RpfG family c-di-GMP phosphodiesterase